MAGCGRPRCGTSSPWPLGGPYEAPALTFSGDALKVGQVSLEEATDEERHATEQVMGGAD
ncbi:hypothetical protein ACFVX6_37435 [Streptomyces sp. NPDC058289]|uniref:hypothetical protein n=1 Tax=Streptomyces sp. NPDC058289 TaxID=3346425 RepID=UPI0036EC580E